MATSKISRRKLLAETQRELDALPPGTPGRTGLLRILAQLQCKARKKK